MVVPCQMTKAEILRLFLLQHAGALRNEETLVLAQIRVQYQQHLKPARAKTKTAFFSAAAELYRGRSATGERLDDVFKLIASLGAELFKSRAETQKALGEREKAESECINAKLDGSCAGHIA